jgi:peptidoglycan hydrolase-like protein with peptidoglycan-binding domain
MSLNPSRRFTEYFIGNGRTAMLTIVILCAFTLFAFNAMYNQPGNHPQPLWIAKNKSATSTSLKSGIYSVPIRKVETLKITPQDVPVPLLRPTRNSDQTKNTSQDTKQPLLDTKKVQLLLRQLGFYEGVSDGLMGPQTLLAVKKFEKSKGLPENANISPSLLLLLQNAVDRSTAKSANGIGKLLERESSKTQLTKPKNGQISPVMITRIQVGLINYGSDDVTIDGVMGKQTKIAIQQFQARFKLEVNGTPSQELIRKLESVGALTRG